MMPKKRRVTKSQFPTRPIQRVSFPFGSVAIFNTKTAKAAVVVSKKVAKSAVQRNRLRRRVYSILRTVFSDARSTNTVVVYPNTAGALATFKELEREIKHALSRTS